MGRMIRCKALPPAPEKKEMSGGSYSEIPGTALTSSSSAKSSSSLAPPPALPPHISSAEMKRKLAQFVNLEI